MRLYPADSITGAAPSGWCLRELFTFIMPWRLRAMRSTPAQQRDMVNLLRATADLLEVFSPLPEPPEVYVERIVEESTTPLSESTS